MLQLDTAVLQFQNQKLVQKLEAQKIEITSLEEKISKLLEKQLPYEKNLAVVNKSLEEVSIYFFGVCLYIYYHIYVKSITTFPQLIIFLIDHWIVLSWLSSFFFVLPPFFSQLVDDLEAHCSLTKNLMRCDPGLKNQFVKCSDQHLTLTGTISCPCTMADTMYCLSKSWEARFLDILN